MSEEIQDLPSEEQVVDTSVEDNPYEDVARNQGWKSKGE